MPRLLIVLLSFAVASCWIGEGLYADSDAKLAIEPGIYRTSAADQPVQQARVTLLSNGMTQITDKDGPDVYGFMPLDAAGTRFAVWLDNKDQKDVVKPVQFYFLGLKHADGSFVLYIPECSGAEAEIARRGGAVLEEGSGASACRFKNRASLEAALRQLHPADENRSLVLTPLKR